MIDHAWTYKVNEARQLLLQYDQLIDRLCSLMNISANDVDENSIKDYKINQILKKMWKFNQTYKLSTDKLVT